MKSNFYHEVQHYEHMLKQLIQQKASKQYEFSKKIKTHACKTWEGCNKTEATEIKKSWNVHI